MVTFGLCLIFFLSGVAALAFENLWFYQAGLAFGNSIWASSLVLAGFMAGLALGNLLAGRLGHRIQRPLRFYAGLEIAIGASGLALVFLLPKLTPLLAALVGPVLESPWLVNPLRLGLGFALLVMPATAMGATLPVIVSALARRDPRFGRVLGLLYGWNTLGAVAGALIGELFLLERLGVRGTGVVAVAVNVAAAAGAWWLSARLETAAPEPARPAPTPLSRRAWLFLLAAACFGFALLGLEVVWFRFLMLFVWGTGASFAILLASVLVGIGLGGLLGSRLARTTGATALLPVFAFLAGAVSLLLYALYPSGLRVSRWVDVARHAGFLMIPVSLVSGTLFTLLGAALEREAPGETRAAGYLTLANTTGAALGSLAVGFLLLPALGIEASWAALSALYGVAGAVLLLAGPRPQRFAERAATLTAAVLLVLALLSPWGLMGRRHLPAAIDFYVDAARDEVAGIREGLTETIVYVRTRAFRAPHHYRMLTNGYSMSSTSFYAQRYMKLFVHLPAALHPKLDSALLISFGVGMTADALAHTASLSRVDVVDISRDVLEMNRIVFPDATKAPLSDPRFHVHVEDGRHYLQTTRRRYDLITGEPPPPKLAGVTSLYTREYFRLVHDRLNEGGLVSYWLPVHTLMGDDAESIIRAFCDVFADCTLFGGAGLDWILLGSRDGIGAVPEQRLARPWRDPVTARELREIGVETPAHLGALFIADAEQLAELYGDVPPVTDDRPKRLSEIPPDAAVSVPRFARWMDPRVTARRFATSRWVAEVWPAGLRGATQPLFADEADYQRATLLGRRPIAAVLPDLDRVLDRTRLTTLPLWLLGSDAERQRAASDLLGDGGVRPGARLERALGLLASRRYGEAADEFARVRGDGVPGTRFRAVELYTRMKAGERGPALRRDLAALGTSDRPGDRKAYAFLADRIDIGGDGSDAELAAP